MGNYQDQTCIQSCSKVFNYAKALHELGADTVHNYVGQEPSGRQFNELTLDYNSGHLLGLGWTRGEVGGGGGLPQLSASASYY